MTLHTPAQTDAAFARIFLEGARSKKIWEHVHNVTTYIHFELTMNCGIKSMTVNHTVTQATWDKHQGHQFNTIEARHSGREYLKLKTCRNKGQTQMQII